MTSDRHTDIQTDRQTYILPLVVLSAALQQKSTIKNIVYEHHTFDLLLFMYFLS